MSKNDVVSLPLFLLLLLLLLLLSQEQVSSPPLMPSGLSPAPSQYPTMRSTATSISQFLMCVMLVAVFFVNPMTFIGGSHKATTLHNTGMCVWGGYREC